MWALLGWLAIAAAATPDEVRPSAAPEDMPTQFATWARGRGRSTDSLVCEPLWPGAAVLCFTWVEGGQRRWVAESDLARWKVERDAFLAEQRARATEAARTVPLVPRAVEGVTGQYFEVAAAERWQAAALAAPDVMRERLQAETLLVAAPTGGVVLVWVPGDPALDKVIAIGVREMYDRETDGVTPVVQQRLPGRWVAFAEAKPKFDR